MAACGWAVASCRPIPKPPTAIRSIGWAHSAGRCLGYVHLVRGTVQVNGLPLQAGDAALLEGEPQLTLSGGVDAELLVFDLAAQA